MTSNELKVMEIAKKYREEILAGKGAKRPGSSLLDGMILGLAKKNHEAWCEGKRAAGYVYGETVDDKAKTTNLLVDFDALPQADKDMNIRNAKKTISLIFEAGFEIHRIATSQERDALIKSMATALHDEWVLGKLQKGYTFGPNRNDDPTKGPLTHRDMLPFYLLEQMYPDDASYDVKTATGIVEGFENLGFRICHPDMVPAIATC